MKQDGVKQLVRNMIDHAFAQQLPHEELVRQLNGVAGEMELNMSAVDRMQAMRELAWELQAVPPVAMVA